MDSICRRADSALNSLWQQCEGIPATCDGRSICVMSAVVNLMRDSIMKFEYEFQCLRIFLDCIHKWSDLDDVLHLGSLVSKVESRIQEIANKLIQNIERPLDKPPHSSSPISKILRKIDDISIQRKIWKLDDLFSGLMSEIMDLKPEIKKAYDSLTSHSFQFRFDFDHWKEFGEFVNYYEEACSKQAAYDQSSPLNRHFKDLNHNLVSAKDFLDCLAKSSVKNLEIKDAMIHVGRVAIGAALRLGERWAGQLDPHEEEIARITVLQLQKKIDLTNPVVVDVNLKLLRTVGVIGSRLENEVDEFVNWLFPLGEDFAQYYLDLVEPHTLNSELKSLVIFVANLPRGDAENVQRLWVDIKVLLTEVAKLTTSYDSTNSAKDQVLQNLLAEIWLIKLEIFLRQQQNTNHILQMPMKEQINALNQGLRNLNYEEWLKSLKRPIEHSPEGTVEKVKQVSALMEEVCKVVTCLDHSFHAEEITTTKEMVRNPLFKLILMIGLFKADSLVKSSHNTNNQSLMVLDENQIEALHKGLEVLIMFVKDQPACTIEEAKLEFAHIEEVACAVRSLCHSLPSYKTREQALKNMNFSVPDLLEKIRLIMVELKVYLHAPNFPKTNGLGFIDSFLEKLRELLKADLAMSMKLQIEEILEDLKFLTPFLRGILEKDIEFQELKDLGASIIDVAYEAEYYLDSMMLEDNIEWHNSIWLYNLQEDIRLVKTHVTTIYNKTHHAKGQDMPQTSVHNEPKATTSIIGEAVVVLTDQEEMLIDRLIGGTPELDIVPIVGMPGMGKTTLAKQVYNSPRVASHFHIRTWCCISEIYRKREVLLEILSHLTALSDDILRMTDEDLDFKLRKLLLKNKFLIVMDDMWSTEALDDLRGSLPNDGNGSRILITTRHHHVALKANPHADPHRLRQLSDAESWNLLQKKIFHEEGCSEELMEVGKEIAESCKGLPLAIVAMAGLLEKCERQYDSWKEIAEDLSFRIVDDPEEQCRQILELSYKHLPDYLKACFLYFGAFLEDQDIPARKLMQLWIAEGFVRKTEFKSLEDLAEEYLMDLIGRSLVIFSQQRSRGGAKACRVHDVLRKLCQSKAKEDRFLMVITGTDESNAPLHDLDYVFSNKFGNYSSSTAYEDHRLCFSSKRKLFIESRPSGPYVRSLLCFAANVKDLRRPYDISFISNNFRVLKVLDLECINVGTSFPEGIGLLVHLRYLAVAGYIDSVPSSIGNLWNLETLIVKGLMDEAVSLPDTIWCLKKLRHVHVSDFAVISLQDDRDGNSFRLEYLVTISSLFLRFGEQTEHMLRQISNLRKLKCIFSDSWDATQNCNNFPSLEVLNQLESLNISYYGQAFHPGEFSFPSNLKKLTLSNFRLPWDKISVIGQLPCLEVLKLLSGAFVGQEWAMVEGEFPELKYLKLDTLNITKWNVCSDHLPKLQQLVLRCCRHLEEIPSSVVEMSTLEVIDVQWCGERVEKSVRQIREEGDEKLKVIINFTELDIFST